MSRNDKAMASVTDIDRVEIRPATSADVAAISRLHASVFGPARYSRTAYRVREGTAAVCRYCQVGCEAAELVGAVRFTMVEVGGRAGALLLGPLAVASSHANIGLGRALVAAGLATARNDGQSIVLLVGDLAYYQRMGFQRVAPGQIKLPGPVDPDRILGAELGDGALANYSGLVTATRRRI